jgi:hypothetical protein
MTNNTLRFTCVRGMKTMTLVFTPLFKHIQFPYTTNYNNNNLIPIHR